MITKKDDNDRRKNKKRIVYSLKEKLSVGYDKDQIVVKFHGLYQKDDIEI
ncbi:hypothetical protein [Blattabacterium sp. (Blatta orientalis)]|nr:hypothetical protein [Blattabacterium sp. (Blatta orientalis)]